MFIINEKNIGVSLDTINIITLTYYSAKSDILTIYDTNFEFDENIVPLISSVLEIESHIIHVKKYINITGESLIIINNSGDSSGDSSCNSNDDGGDGNEDNTNTSFHKSKLEYPCFFYDVKNNDKMQNIQGYNKKLINTLDINDSEMLVRMYKLDQKKGEFGNCILNEEELTIIIWNWEYANFQIIINNKKPNYCQLQMNVYITEENKLISSKIEHINNILVKLDKIKNVIISRNDEI